MAVYEYICLGCERTFEQRRPIDAAVDTALVCPSCGDDRVRRRFSVFGVGSGSRSGGEPSPSAGGCCGGGACACGH
jgi:putative FmdB family regulatory protein